MESIYEASARSIRGVSLASLHTFLTFRTLHTLLTLLPLHTHRAAGFVPGVFPKNSVVKERKANTGFGRCGAWT